MVSVNLSFLRRFFLLGALFLFSGLGLNAQRPYWEMMQDSIVDLKATVAAFDQYWAGRTPEKGQGYRVFQRWAYRMQLMQDQNGQVPAPGAELLEMERWKREAENQRRTALTPTGSWTTMGPEYLPVNNVGQPGGIARTTTIAFHPTNPNTLYAGTPNGGLWLSLDNGVSWTAKSDFLPTLGVSAIAIDPLAPANIFIGTGDKDGSNAAGLGVYMSNDGGSTWNVSNTGMGNRTVHSIVFDPNNNTTLLAATNNGVYRSVNSGANWTQVLAGGTFYQLEYKKGSTSTLFAINNVGLFTSLDDGATWNGGVAISSATRGAFSLTAADPDYIYVVKNVVTNPVFRSTDGGATFTNVQTDGLNLLNASCAGTGTGGQGSYDICIMTHPGNRDEVIVGGVSLWKSVNGGTSFSIAGCWSSMVTNIHADHHFLALSPHHPARVFVCNDGGVYYTDDFGSSYTNISTSIAASLIYRVGLSGSNPSVLVGGFQDNGMIISRQPNWFITVGGDGTECAIDPTNDNYQYGSYVNGVIRRSSNGGYNWSTIANNGTGGIDEDGPWLTPYVLQPGNPNVMLAGYVSVWRCTNVKAGSPVFTKVLPFGSSDIRDLAFADPNTAYVSRSNGEFWQSLDGGITWVQMANPPGGAARDIATDPLNPQRLWVASGNNIYQSVDGAATWVLYDTGLPNIVAYTVVYDKVADALYCGMSIGVYYRHTTDPSWVSYSTNLPNTSAHHLQIFYDQNGCVGRDKLVLATYGRGIWQSDLRSSATQVPVACFGADTTRVCVVAQAVQLRDSSAYDPNTWLWTITGPGMVSFVGGTTATDQNPRVTFPVNGFYTVELTASNGNGSDTRSRVSFIEVVTPTVAFNSNDSLIYQGQAAQFTDASADCVTDWLWDFGDGFTSTLQNPSHTYATAGRYTVSLTINGGVNSLTRTGYMQVLPHLPVPYTSATAAWSGDMEDNLTEWHYGNARLNGNRDIWERGAVTLTFPAAASGSNCWVTDLDANLPVSSYSCVVRTPTFDMSAAGNYQVRMKTAMESVFCNAPHGVQVEYTTDLGATWTLLGGKQGTDPNAFYNWYNRGGTGGCDNADVVPSRIGWNYSGLNFRQAIYDASALAGNARVGFRVAFYSSQNYGSFTVKGFAFDDFELDYAPSPDVPDTIPGSMIAFDGVDDFVETYYDRDLSNFTMETWVMSPAAPTATARTSIAQKSNVFEFNWNHPSGGSRGAMAMRNSAAVWQSFSFGPLLGNTWYHLAVTFDGTTVNTYKNGLLVTSAPFTGTLTSNTNTLQLGIGAATLNGSIDEFRIWNVVRSQQEIREAMHRTLDPAELGSVVLYYQGNEPSGYLKDVIKLRHGYLQNGLGRVLSPIAVGKGVSQSMVVTATGNYNFATTGLALNFNAAAGTPFDITVTRINQFVNQQTPNPSWNAAPNTTLVDNNPYFYHVVNKFGGAAFNTDVMLSGVPDISAAEALAPSALKWVKRASNSVGVWDLGIPASAATVSSGFNGTATFLGITTFSQAFLGSELSDILPISALNLQAMESPSNDAILLAWELETLPGDVRWTLQRANSVEELAANNVERLTIGTGAGFGEAFRDEQVTIGQTYYYQIIGQNVNGEQLQSNVVMAQLTGASHAMHIIPNPSNGQFQLSYIGDGRTASMQIVDLQGKVLWSESHSTTEGLLHQTIDASTMPAGVYFFQLKQGAGTTTEKIVVLK